MEIWDKFKGSKWKESIDVSDFIINNYTEYKGDESFLVRSTDKTNKVWGRCKELISEEMKKGILDVDTVNMSGIDSGLTSFIVVGEGAKMKILNDELAKYSKCFVKEYYPEAIGIRDSSFCSVYGALFVYKEKAYLNSINVSCVDIAEYDSVVDLKKEDTEGESITNKIKKLFDTYRGGLK